MSTTYTAYRRVRREYPGLPASHALAILRRREAPAWAASFDQVGDDYVGTVDGWDIRIMAEPDEDADLSWLGTWTDDPTDAVPNSNGSYGSYKYFRPEPSILPTPADLRKAGMPSSRVPEAIRESMQAAEREAHITPYDVTVRATRDGQTGYDSLGGVYASGDADLLWTVDDHDMVAAAIDAAKAERYAHA